MSENICLKIFSNPNDLLRIENNWNNLIKRSCETPFSLSAFCKEFTEYSLSTGWHPLVLVLSEGNKIVGVAPLKIREKYGIRSAELINISRTSGELSVEENYQDIFFSQINNYLFDTLNCKFVNIQTTNNSTNLDIYKRECEKKGITFCKEFSNLHSVIKISQTWEEYEASRGANFRGKFRRIKKKLDKTGSWKILSLTEDTPEVTKKILEVEQNSWKSDWRATKNLNSDEQLNRLLAASIHTANVEPTFSWGVWFFELDGKTLAYCFVITYKKVVYLTKTSYNKAYSRLYLGVFLLNHIIQESFKSQNLAVDFITDLPLFQTWNSEHVPQVTVKLTKGMIPKMMRLVSENTILNGLLLDYQQLHQ